MGSTCEFATADALRLERLERTFETVLDCGLFHTFDRDERPGYVASLALVTRHDGTLYLLCFSDEGPDTGPHPVSPEELRAAFSPGAGWNVAGHRAGPDPDEIPRRRRTGLARDDHADLGRGADLVDAVDGDQGEAVPVPQPDGTVVALRSATTTHSCPRSCLV